MAASSAGGFTTPFSTIKLRKFHDDVSFLNFHHCRTFELADVVNTRCRRRVFGDERVNLFVCSKNKNVGKSEEWRRKFDLKEKSLRRVRSQALPSLPFTTSPPTRFRSKPRCTPRNFGPQSRDTPPKRDTGIANEKDWGISLLNGNVNEAGINEDGSTWYRESGDELGENGYRCRWTRMGGQSQHGSSEWKEMWWEKSDWTG